MQLQPYLACRGRCGVDGGARAATMPFQKTFGAERFGMLVDKFGTPWMVNCESTKT